MPFCPERLERVRRLLRECVDSSEMPMASLRVARHGELILDEAHGESAPSDLDVGIRHGRAENLDAHFDTNSGLITDLSYTCISQSDK